MHWNDHIPILALLAICSPLCKPPLAKQVPFGKGVDRLIGFSVSAGLKNRLPDDGWYAIICIRNRSIIK